MTKCTMLLNVKIVAGQTGLNKTISQNISNLGTKTMIYPIVN